MYVRKYQDKSYESGFLTWLTGILNELADSFIFIKTVLIAPSQAVISK